MTAQKKNGRQLLRMAVKIHEHLVGPAKNGAELQPPHTTWHQLCEIARRLRHVRRRGWQVALQTVAFDLDYTAAVLIRHLEALRQSAGQERASVRVHAASEIASDLEALDEEFQQLEIDLKERRISVVIPPITLDDVYLGPFKIALDYERIGSSQPYSVIAQDPHYAAEGSEVSHPHVQEGQLCEGEGAPAIRSALLSGRLYDFFVLIRQVLHTYNASSAHVALANWQGRGSCWCCGSSLADDASCTCERCEEQTCDDCTWGCCGCRRSICSSCSSDCAMCHDRFCLACLTKTGDAGQLVCEPCLEAQQKKEDEKQDEHEPPIEKSAEEPPVEVQGATATSGTAADAVRVGQTPLPARSRSNRGRRLRRQSSPRIAAR